MFRGIIFELSYLSSPWRIFLSLFVLDLGEVYHFEGFPMADFQFGAAAGVVEEIGHSGDDHPCRGMKIIVVHGYESVGEPESAAVLPAGDGIAGSAALAGADVALPYRPIFIVGCRARLGEDDERPIELNLRIGRFGLGLGIVLRGGSVAAGVLPLDDVAGEAVLVAELAAGLFNILSFDQGDRNMHAAGAG